MKATITCTVPKSPLEGPEPCGQELEAEGENTQALEDAIASTYGEHYADTHDAPAPPDTEDADELAAYEELAAVYRNLFPSYEVDVT